MSAPTAAILGSGRFALAVARVLGKGGSTVRVWSRHDKPQEDFSDVEGSIELTGDMEKATKNVQVVFFGVPASAVEEVANQYGDYAKGDHIVIHACRGVADGFLLAHKAIRNKTCVRKIGALGGPLHAKELNSGRPLAAVLASRFDEVIHAIKHAARGTSVRIHPSKDVVGVEVAGAISNVSAIAKGMADALEIGDTATGILLTHGLVEAQRLGCAMGALPATFTGLAGVGDLIPRDVSSTDRHRSTGSQLVAGKSIDEILSAAEGEVEGVRTARCARDKALQLGLQLPLITGVADVLDGKTSPSDALDAVLQKADIELGHGLR